jgi:hypothetical protein
LRTIDARRGWGVRGKGPKIVTKNAIKYEKEAPHRFSDHPPKNNLKKEMVENPCKNPCTVV